MNRLPHRAWMSAKPARRCRFLLLCGLFCWIASAHHAQGATYVYSTYFGGSVSDGAMAIVVDSAGNAYIGGGTQSSNDFPILNAFQPDYGGGFNDTFLAKFDPAGRLLFSTYFGGAGWEYINAIALDLQGNVVVAGQTTSTDLPTTADAFQPDYGGGSAVGTGDGFLAKFTPDGARLLYCSYFGGSGDESIYGMAIDAAGNVCLTGQTDSTDLPLQNPLRPQANDGFVAKFDATLTNLIFSTYFGGENQDELKEDLYEDEFQRIAVDPAGFIYVCGATMSTSFPVTAGAFQTRHAMDANLGSNWDAFISKFTPDGSALVYSTYVGSVLDDIAYAVAADAVGSAYVTGLMETNLDAGTVPLGFQPTPGFGGSDGWVAKLTPDGSNLEWCSYLGGSGPDQGLGLALDQDNNVFVTGITSSLDFPTVDAPQPQIGGGQDAFVAKISADGQRLIYSTYLGGSLDEWGSAVAVDSSGNSIATGFTSSVDFPVLNAFQATNASVQNEWNTYIAKFSPAVEPPQLTIKPSGNNVLLTWTTNATGFSLETAEASVESLAWFTVTGQPLVIGGQNTVIQSISGTARFYRLNRP